MGWGTSLVHETYYSKEIYKSKLQVQEAINEEKNNIQRCKQSIFALCVMTEPNKMLQAEENMSTVETIQYLTEDLFKELEESLFRLNRLEVLLEEWDDCFIDGKPRKPSFKEDECFKPFMFGNFNEEEYDSRES